MESAVLGVIIDSSVAIEAEGERLDVGGFLKRIAGAVGEREAALCSVSVAELAHGIYRANTPETRERLIQADAWMAGNAATETDLEQLAARVEGRG